MMQRDFKDDWWKARNLRPHLKKIAPAMMTVGGWFDAENLLDPSKFIARSRPAVGAAALFPCGFTWANGAVTINCRLGSYFRLPPKTVSLLPRCARASFGSDALDIGGRLICGQHWATRRSICVLSLQWRHRGC